MQKWCPNAFESPSEPIKGMAAADGTFESDLNPVFVEEGSPASRFRSESRFIDSKTLLGHLTRKERTLLFDLVEQDVAKDYQKRENEVRADCESKVREMEESFLNSLNNLSAELEGALAGQLEEISAASARLAVQLAGKIVRKSTELDPEVLARALETTYYRLFDNCSLTLNVNPVDAEWLENKTDLLKSLKIEKVTADRRVERGGCTIRAGAREWDATIARQLESLAEIVEDSIATSENTGKITPQEDPDDSQLG